MKTKTCSYQNCNNPAFSKGRCAWHMKKKPMAKQSKPMRRTPIKNMSSKRSKKQAVYTVLRKSFLLDHPICQICDSNRAAEIHHTHAGADRDKFMNDTTTWMALCSFCHREIHENPIWARENGYLK